MKRLALAALLACHAPAPPEPKPRIEAPPAASASLSLDAAPIAPAAIDAGADVDPTVLAGEKLQTWRVGDFEVAASLPVGARERRPVVVGIHGSRDRHDATCARWRRTFAGWAFVVCPQGVPYRGGLAWGSPLVMAERIDRALAALRERYGAFVAEGPVVYAGWSLGATRGPAAVGARPGVFEPIVLAEAGHTRIDAAASLGSLRKGRASHLLVACATKRCARFEKRLEGAKGKKPGPTIALVDAGIGRGHLFDDAMSRAIGAAVAKAVADDPRWSGFAAALAAPPEDAPALDGPPEDDDADP